MSISPTFFCSFFVWNLKAHIVYFKFVANTFLCSKNIGGKAALKMLVKLTIALWGIRVKGANCFMTLRLNLCQSLLSKNQNFVNGSENIQSMRNIGLSINDVTWSQFPPSEMASQNPWTTPNDTVIIGREGVRLG